MGRADLMLEAKNSHLDAANQRLHRWFLLEAR